jgi:mannitol/fructose-specific phosphotransferase system IIA component (Ntr-type)
MRVRNNKLQISRLLKPDLIRLEMTTVFEDFEEDDGGPLTPKKLLERKRQLLLECSELLDLSGKVSNRSKLLTDMFNREKKATTAIGKGIVIPHIRTMQAKELIIGVLRSTPGYEFDSLDGTLSHIFVPMAAPPYDDTLYLRVFKSLAHIFSADGFYDRIMSAEQPYDVIRVFEDLE